MRTRELQPGLMASPRVWRKVAGCIPRRDARHELTGEALAAGHFRGSGEFAIPGAPKNRRARSAAERGGIYYRFPRDVTWPRVRAAPALVPVPGRQGRSQRMRSTPRRSGTFADQLALNLQHRPTLERAGRWRRLPADTGRFRHYGRGCARSVVAALGARPNNAQLIKAADRTVLKSKAKEEPPDRTALATASDLLKSAREEAATSPVAAASWLLAANSVEGLAPDRLRVDAETRARDGGRGVVGL